MKERKKERMKIIELKKELRWKERKKETNDGHKTSVTKTNNEECNVAQPTYQR